MEYIHRYSSPLGEIVMASDKENITGLWFSGQKYFPNVIGKERELEIFERAKKWLNTYFSGLNPRFEIPVRFSGTPFQTEVWEMLCRIPYGSTVTYGELAAKIAEKRGISRMSAQAVGGAVGRNRISIIVPCHRVIGADGSLTGYAGGIETKRELLRIEGIEL